MVSKYRLVMSCEGKPGEDNRILAHFSYGVINESGQHEADLEAMEQLGLKLVKEAKALRKYANMGVA